jgi:hypothetical protein
MFNRIPLLVRAVVEGTCIALGIEAAAKRRIDQEQFVPLLQDTRIPGRVGTSITPVVTSFLCRCEHSSISCVLTRLWLEPPSADSASSWMRAGSGWIAAKFLWAGAPDRRSFESSS